MSLVELPRGAIRNPIPKVGVIALPSFGAGREAVVLQNRFLVAGTGLAGGQVREELPTQLSLRDQLAHRSLAFKRRLATMAMYFDPGWRENILRAMEEMMHPDNWDPEFALPSEHSFSTFLRMIIYLHPTKRPGLGISPRGYVLAAWTRENDRIIIECQAKDQVRWVLTRTRDGEKERGAGVVLLHRVPDVIAPYEPELLFQHEEKLLI